MEKKCCSVNVTELDNGYRFEITGDELKDRCKAIIENCCTAENIKKCFPVCGGTK